MASIGMLATAMYVVAAQPAVVAVAGPAAMSISVRPGSGSLTAGFFHTCAIKSDATVACWGDNSAGQASPPSGPFTQVSGGSMHTCGVRANATVACWGDNLFGQASPPSGSFRQVVAGGYHTCGIRPDATVVCWGQNASNQATPPAGTFTQVSGGTSHTCGITSDATAVCWGFNGNGQASPPTGTFTQVSAGEFHTCGIKTDATVACWGDQYYGQSNPPPATFTQVSSGEYHTCGIKTDATIACWGEQYYGQSSPPPATFTQVSSGEYHTCGIKTDATVTCWGGNGFGQASPPAPSAPAAQSIVFTSIPPLHPVVGGSYVVAATASSGLAVSFSADAASAGICTASGAVVTFVRAGTCVINANQAGNASYLGAPQAQTTVTVGRGPQSIAFTAPLPATPVVGGSYVEAAAATSALAVTFSADASSAGICTVSGATVTFVGAGTCVVDANQPGNADYLAASSSRALIVYGAPTVSVVVASAEPSTFAHAVTFTAGVGGDGRGTVDFFSDREPTAIHGCAAVPLIPVGGSYQATCTTSALPAGHHAIVASYSGDAMYAPSTATLSHTVVQAPKITSAAQATFTIGVFGSFAVTAIGFPAPSLAVTGPLPSGVTFNSTSGAINGTPARGTAGSYRITLRASDGLGAIATQLFTLSVHAGASTSADFGGDGRSDIGVFRSSTGTWYIDRSSGGATIANWGAPGDIAVPGDYNGDGRTDIAVFRPSTGTWYISVSGGGTTIANWGAQGDIPVPGDYNGDGKTDIAIYHPATGTWYISVSGGGATIANWGAPGDIPVPGDYNGDGKVDVAVFRPATGTWYINLPGHGGTVTSWAAQGGDVPVSGDYDGDGRTDLALYRPTTGGWYVVNSGGTGVSLTNWGSPGDKPIGQSPGT